MDAWLTTFQNPVVVAALINLIPLLFVAYQNWRISANVQVIHTATNSMKDALVASTAKASKAEGVAEGRASRSK